MDAGDYAAVIGVWLVAIAAPGPDVVLVLRQTVRGGRRAGVAAAIGIALGIVAWIALAMAGAHLLVEADDRILATLQVLGGGYLVFLGVSGLRSALMPGGAHEFELASIEPAPDGSLEDRIPLDAVVHAGPGVALGGGGAFGGSATLGAVPAGGGDDLTRRSFGLGLLTNLSNPKALVFFGTVFTVLVPEGTGAGDRVALSIVLVAIATAWFGGLAVFTSSAKVGAFLGRHAARLDTIAAVAFIVLGLFSLGSGVAALL